MLILFQFEQCPFCRKVREKLTELELDFLSINASHDSEKRKGLLKLAGKEQVPFLIDTEKGVMMLESGDIVKYLEENYSKK